MRRAADTVRDPVLPAFVWNAGGHVIRQVLALGFLVVQARLLAPADFGLVALATAVVALAELVAQLGLPAAIVHRRDVESRHLTSAFWLCGAAGLALTAGLSLAAPAIARVLDTPTLAPVLAVLAINVVILATAVVPNALRAKQLDFHVLTMQDTTALAVSGAVGTALAWNGFGVWSLVGQAIVSAVAASAIAWSRSAWHPSLAFDVRALRELRPLAAPSMATNLVHVTARYVDHVLVGRFLGPTALGIYGRAYALVRVPTANLSAVFTRVLFPSLVRVGDDRARAAALFLGVVRATALVTFPMMAGLLATAEPFVLTVLGARWIEAIPLVRILALVGMVQSIAALAGSLFLSAGRADLHLRLSLVLTAHMTMAVIVGLRWGTVGVAACYASAVAINGVPVLWLGGRLIGVSLAAIGRAVARPLAASAVMVAAVSLVGAAVGDWSPPATLAAQIGCGAVVYAAMVWAIDRSTLREAWSSLTSPEGTRQGSSGSRRPAR